MTAANVPTTPAAMFDQLHEWFGIGSYDEVVESRPWHRERMVEIAKLKALLKSRRASLTEVFVAAQYARTHNKPIQATWQVFSLIPEAMRDRFRAATENRRTESWISLSDAIEEARDAGEDAWVDRLMRADDHAKAVEEWRTRDGR